MPTPTTNFRLGRDTLVALERIADLVNQHRSRPVTTADVIRWLAALHDPKNDPDLAFSREQALAFPAVVRSRPEQPFADAAAGTSATGATAGGTQAACDTAEPS